MDDDKTGKRCVGTPVPGCPQIPSRREAHLHYLRKTNPNTQKQEAHHNRFHGKDVLNHYNEQNRKNGRHFHACHFVRKEIILQFLQALLHQCQG